METLLDAIWNDEETNEMDLGEMASGKARAAMQVNCMMICCVVIPGNSPDPPVLNLLTCSL